MNEPAIGGTPSREHLGARWSRAATSMSVNDEMNSAHAALVSS
jgi:hypothetical protein